MSDEKRVSHDLLMQAQEALGKARDAEQAAGHNGVAMILNEFALGVFRVALEPDIDRAADALHAERYPEDVTQ